MNFLMWEASEGQHGNHLLHLFGVDDLPQSQGFTYHL